MKPILMTDVVMGPAPIDFPMPNGKMPLSWRIGRARYRVKAVQDVWTEVGRWWEKEVEQIIYRVFTTDMGLFEVAMVQTRPPQWFMLKKFD